MSGFLIGEEGLLAGVTIPFEEGVAEEWIIGRDPAFCQIVLEDPMVSRRHLLARLTPEGVIIENLSTINPAMQNGHAISEPVLLKDGDHIEIGSTLFRYEQKKEEEKSEEIEEEPEESAPFEETSPEEPPYSGSDGRWLLKVVSGPNAGAEFGMQKSSTYILGKDPNVCDIIFQDTSVSREHARLTVDENYRVFIEDLSSKNGVILNGSLIAGRQELYSQDLISLGTTSFIVIDREQAPETIISPPMAASIPEKVTVALEKEELPAKKERAPIPHWRDLVIPKRHLILAGLFAFLILVCVAGMFSLFKTEPIVVKEKNESEEIQKAIAKYYPAVQFSFNQSTGKLFLVGHVLTSIDKQELTYTLQQLPYITSIEDNVVIDELVWESMNALLLQTSSSWVGVTVTSSSPGKFVLRGYLETLDQAQALTDYINLNFPYLDRLENQVVVESNLQAQIQTALIEKGFSNVTFQLSNGEVVFAGRADEKQSRVFNHLIDDLKSVPGIRLTKNYVVFTSAESTRIDLSGQYRVSGYSKRDSESLYIVINGRILSLGDTLDGMTITALQPNTVLLEKDGLKYRINYNLQ